jgi:hypothetical protein
MKTVRVDSRGKPVPILPTGVPTLLESRQGTTYRKRYEYDATTTAFDATHHRVHATDVCIKRFSHFCRVILIVRRAGAFHFGGAVAEEILLIAKVKH